MKTSSSYWQLSSKGVGLIAEGLEDIRQCIDNILRTRKGSDPLRPLFGSDVFNWVDRPLPQAIPNIKKAILEALEIWEKRIQVKSVIHEFQEKYTAFQITYQSVDQELQDLLTMYIGPGFTNVLPSSGYIILTASIPKELPPNKQLKISLECNGNQVSPNPPRIGFVNPYSLLTWVQDNWGAYGTWYMTADKIILYMKPGICNSPALTISLIGYYIFSDDFITPTPGNYFAITFLPDGKVPNILFPENEIITREDLLNWILNHWRNYGNWSLERDKLVLETEQFDQAVLVVHTSDISLLYFDDCVVLLDLDYVLIKH